VHQNIKVRINTQAGSTSASCLRIYNYSNYLQYATNKQKTNRSAKQANALKFINT